MKKKLLIISVLAVCMLGVYGCATKTDDANKETTTVCTYEKETDKDTENYTFTLTATGDSIMHVTIINDLVFKDKDTYTTKRNDTTFRDYTKKYFSVTFTFDDSAMTEHDAIEADYKDATEDDIESGEAHNINLKGFNNLEHSNGKYSLKSFKQIYGDKGYDCRDKTDSTSTSTK